MGGLFPPWLQRVPGQASSPPGFPGSPFLRGHVREGPGLGEDGGARPGAGGTAHGAAAAPPHGYGRPAPRAAQGKAANGRRVLSPSHKELETAGSLV